MKLDVFRHFEGKQEANSPFCQTLDRLNIDYRIFFGGHSLHYTHRIWLILVEWPRLFFFAALRSFVILFGRRHSDFVLAWTHLEALPTILLKSLLFRKDPKIVLVGFIYTPRSNSFLQRIRYWYFRWLLGHIHCAVVHSQIELYDYTQLFGFWRKKFVLMPFGTHVNIIPPPNVTVPYIFSAGRSGRDYNILLKVMENLPYHLRIACDMLHPEADCQDRVTVLRNCYNSDYLRELTGAELVVITLAAKHISAGQMVLIESMGLGKPVIITQTETTQEYAQHDKNVWFVPMGDEEKLKEAIDYFMERPDERKRIGDEARKTFHEKYSMEAATERLCQLLNDMSTGNWPPRNGY